MSEPGQGSHWRMRLFEVALAVAACTIALMLAASTGDSDQTGTTTFASSEIECAASPGATGQVFLKAHATDYEIIAARLAIASVPGVIIDQYLDHQGAFAQLSCVFPDTPRLARSIHPVDVPVSFAITADTSTTARLREIPSVQRVVTPDTWNAWWISVNRERDAKDVGAP